MEERLVKIFKGARYEPEQNLRSVIWHTIVRRQKREAVMKFWTFFLVGAAAGFACVPAFSALARDFATSGFSEYFSLAFSSGGVIASYWREFLLSLTDSLPVGSIMVSLSLVLIFFLSLRFALKEFIKGQLKMSF